MILKAISEYAVATAALWEIFFPQSHKITWLERQVLAEKKSCAARIATADQDSELIALVTAVYAKGGDKPPKIIIYDSEKSNAMHLQNGTLAVSSGKLKQADPQMLEATIAHEYGHHKQNTLSLAIILGRFTAITLAANFLTNKLRPQFEKTGSLFSMMLVGAYTKFLAAGHLITELPFKAYRRWQEYDADKWSVKLTGSAQGMIKNLEAHAAAKTEEKLTSHHQKEPDIVAKTWKALTRSHPSHEQRIAYLRQEESRLKEHIHRT